jgi:hypothetical protein
MARTRPGRKAGPRDKLRKELVSLLEQVDDEGLVFLIRQAQMIIRNLQVDRLNKEIGELNQQRARALAGRQKKPGSRSRQTVDAVDPVTIDEGTGRTTFIVAIGSTRKVFSLDEMRALARVAQAADDDADGARRLYSWLSRNRRDVLIDMSAGSAKAPGLVLMHRAIRKRYKPRSG